MKADLAPETVLRQLESGRRLPVYLFYGPGEFRLEKSLVRFREALVSESLRDFNFRVFYGAQVDPSEKAEPGDILETARSVPFMAPDRLVVVRGVEGMPAASPDRLLPYVDDPVDSTCLIFVASKPDFRTRFFAKFRDKGLAVHFRQLTDSQVVPWIKSLARELGLNIDDEACAYLQEIVGNRLRDLYAELEKIFLRHGAAAVGIREVKELAIYSRSYTVFELMDHVSFRRRPESLAALSRYMQEEGKGRDAALGVLGMLNRQVNLLWCTLGVISEGGRSEQVVRKLGIREFQARALMQQAKHWRPEELESACHLLYQADGLLKSSSPGVLVLESLILALCR